MNELPSFVNPKYPIDNQMLNVLKEIKNYRESQPSKNNKEGYNQMDRVIESEINIMKIVR